MGVWHPREAWRRGAGVGEEKLGLNPVPPRSRSLPRPQRSAATGVPVWSGGLAQARARAPAVCAESLGGPQPCTCRSRPAVLGAHGPCACRGDVESATGRPRPRLPWLPALRGLGREGGFVLAFPKGDFRVQSLQGAGRSKVNCLDSSSPPKSQQLLLCLGAGPRGVGPRPGGEGRSRKPAGLPSPSWKEWATNWSLAETSAM